MAQVGVGMLGYSFMGKAHSLGYRDVQAIADVRVPRPRLVCIHGRNAERLAEARERYGWERSTADWRDLIADPEVQLLDNSGPNDLHIEPTIAAAQLGKHVYCEKPLGPTAEDSHRVWREVERTGVKHMCAFNYRFFPAMQRARDIIRAGEIGTIHHYRAQFLVSSSLEAERGRTWRDTGAAGGGALGDLGSHHIDLSRFLLGSDPVTVTGLTRVVIPRSADGGTIETDDLYAALLEYGNGAIGVLEASRVAGGHLVTSRVEIDGSLGSLRFTMQRLNELQVAGPDRSFRKLHVIGKGDPYNGGWFPPGHPLGWVDTFSHEAAHMLGAIGGLHEVGPIGATFEDGYRCAEIVEAIQRSSRSHRREDITYRSLADPWTADPA